MPDIGRYVSEPRPESVDKLIEFLKSNPVVTRVTQQGPQVLEIERKDKSTLNVFLTNIYVVSEADVAEISALNRIQAIVTMSAWNGYTGDAKTSARAKGIGLFKFREFLGAVYYDGKRFLDYTPPDPNKKRTSKS